PTTWKKQNSWNSPSTPGSSGQRKRKVQLLPSRRGDQLTLLGYSITAEDLDLEKKASLQWFNKVLEDKTEPAGVTTTVADSPPKTPSPLASLSSSQSGAVPATSSDSRSTTAVLGLTPASSPGPITDAAKSPSAETSAKSQALSTPPPSPKQSILFGMLSTPAANPPASVAPAVSSASPTFKPIFVAPPKSENGDPLPSSPSTVTAVASSSSTLPTTTSSPAPAFKPIFSSVGPPTSMPGLTPFFKQTAPLAATTSAPLFTGQATATSTVTSVSTASTSTDSAPKPAFSFGVSSVTSTLSSVTSTTASTSQPFLFGTPPTSGTSTPTFGQNTPAPGVGAAGGSLSFGASSTPAQGFVGVGPFGSAAPSFSIGAGSKTPGARQRLQARRQHTRKK
ncbi:hypothetical protein Celaphus_00007193, partial [Cervus elaphus hippelaphus]